PLRRVTGPAPLEEEAATMRGGPSLRRGRCRVGGSPSAIPDGVRATKDESSLAERRGATSHVNQEGPWLIATIFSLITKYQGADVGIDSAGRSAAKRSTRSRTSASRSSSRAISPVCSG